MVNATATPAASGGERETLNVDGVAKLLGVSRPTIYRHLDRLPSPVKFGKRVFWFKDELVSHLRERKGGKS